MKNYTTQYFDGVQSDPVLVSLSLDELRNVLEIQSQDKSNYKTIALSEISLITEVGSNIQIEFKTKDPAFPSELLLISDVALATEIERVWRSDKSSILNLSYALHNINIWKKLAYTLAITIVAISALRLGFENLYKITPTAYDSYLGNKAKTKILSVVETCETEELDRFLEKAQKELSLKTDRFEYEIQVVNHPMENAFALPGGHLFVFKGLLENSKTPEEVIGVLAHEIEHVENRHSIKQIQKNLGIILITSLVIGTAFEGVEVFENAELLSEIISGFLLMKYSRGFEIEADQKAIYRLKENGFSTQGILDFFHRLEDQTIEIKGIVSGDSTDSLNDYWGEVKDVLSTHPSHEKRIEYFEEALSAPLLKPNNSFVFESENWEEIKLACPESKKVDIWDLF